MSNLLKQIWQCVNCKSNRQWGFGLPQQKRRANDFAFAMLKCCECKTATKHIYSGLAE